MEKICAMLAEARTDKGITAEEASKLLGISKKTLSLYENNHRNIPLNIFYKMCILYDVSADYILFGKK